MMKVFVEVDDKYILLEVGLEVDNFDNDNIRDDVISNAMDKIENYRLSKEMIKQVNAGYLVKKLGLHPDMIEN
ncbi:MAG: hypothetical protein MRZ42_04375 [Tenericutes bacterium]|nr:hypothetical protein [Mycoplasmatota bacterium]